VRDCAYLVLVDGDFACFQQAYSEATSETKVEAARAELPRLDANAINTAQTYFAELVTRADVARLKPIHLFGSDLKAVQDNGTLLLTEKDLALREKVQVLSSVVRVIAAPPTQTPDAFFVIRAMMKDHLSAFLKELRPKKQGTGSAAATAALDPAAVFPGFLLHKLVQTGYSFVAGAGDSVLYEGKSIRKPWAIFEIFKKFHTESKGKHGIK